MNSISYVVVKRTAESEYLISRRTDDDGMVVVVIVGALTLLALTYSRAAEA